MSSSNLNPAARERLSALANIYANMSAHGAASADTGAANAADTPAQARRRNVLTAWERWEMGALADNQGPGAPVRKPLPRPAPPPPVAAPPSLDELAVRRMRLEARARAEEEGRREGHAAGHAAGHAEGLAVGLAAASAQAEQLRALALSLPEAVQRAERELGDTVLVLALEVARQVIHRTLASETDWVVSLVRDLLQSEPALQGEPRLLLHPDDVLLVRSSLGQELERAGWQLRADDTLTRGGCKVQSAAGEMDASLDTRWKNVTAALRGHFNGLGD